MRKSYIWRYFLMERQKEMRYTLPKEFDVFCIGDIVRGEFEGDLKIPGNLYVSGFLDVFGLTVDGSLTVDDFIDAGNITVNGGSCICGGNVTAGNVSVSNGDFFSNGDIDTQDITVHNGDCIVLNGTINSFTIKVDGTLDSHDVDSNGREVHATDYVCRCLEEEN